MNERASPAILDHLTALSDTTRSRMLLLLDRHELTVSELCSIMQLPQSTVSRHLKALADSGWIAARAEGTSHLYTMTRDELDAARAPAVAAGPRTGRADAGGGAGSAPAAGGARRAAHASRRSSSRRRPASGIGCATSCSAIAFTWRRWRRSPTATGSSAISAAAPARSAPRSRRSSRA